MDIFFLIIGLLAGSLIGFLFAKSKFKAGPADQSNPLIQALQTEKAVLEEKVRESERSNLKFAEDLKQQLASTKEELQQERSKLADANQSLVSSRTFFKAQEEKINEQKQQITDLQTTLTKEFENIANRIMEEKSLKFTEQNKANLSGILDPLKERIKDFEDKVDKSYKSEADERSQLKGEIKKLFELNQKISEEASNLTKALKGDTKKQGNWGELVLEKILEASGLIEGQNYTLQGKGMSLSDENGNRLQPDVIIRLPESKHIIIDSKVSLVAYEKLVNSADEDSREKLIKEHLLSIKTHISGLSAKNYQDIYGINSPDFVLLFIPIESSFSMATQYDQDLFDFAWSKRVVLVTPSTLLATLKTVASIWKQEQQTKNAIDIATKAGALYDKFVGFIEDLKKIGEQIERSQKTYNDAFGKLQTGSGNLIGRVEALKKLGAKTSKQIDQQLLNDEENEEENLLN